MALWYAQGSSRPKDSGKFHVRKRFGTAKRAGEHYRDWSYDLISHQIGASIRRTSYNVSIVDPLGHQVEYLRGFPSIERAGAAAREWIDEILSKIAQNTGVGGIGNIPSLPTSRSLKKSN